MEKIDAAVIITAVLNAVDGWLATYFWHFEINPLLLLIGPLSTAIFKTLLSLVLVAIWFRFEGARESSLSVKCVWFGLWLYVLITTVNLIAILA